MVGRYGRSIVSELIVKSFIGGARPPGAAPDAYVKGKSMDQRDDE
jgi:hypothetical protein